MPETDYRSLTAATVRTGFISGDRDIDGWFFRKAWNDHAARKHIVTCASFDHEPERVVGFYALSAVVEELSRLGANVPFFAFKDDSRCACLQLTYMAIHKDHQSVDHGTLMLGAIIERFADIGQEIGLPALILTPGSDRAAKFYRERGGFEPYAKGGGMFMPLTQAIKTVAAAAEDALNQEPITV